jgi:prepilin-type N-terminal cleavage/methylation domain-containing protein
MTVLHHIQKGFTLLETLASVAILSLVIIGPLSVTISSSSYARITKDTMVATFLAEEAVELLQNQYDSLYVYCKKNTSSTEAGGVCEATGTETTGQTSWRVFKNKLSAVEPGQPTCYLPKGTYGNESYPGNAAGNADGCSFDYMHMIASSTETLVRYDSSDENCEYLVPTATSTRRYVQNTQDQMGYHVVTSTSTSYVCSGVPCLLYTSPSPRD